MLSNVGISKDAMSIAGILKDTMLSFMSEITRGR